MGQPVAPVETQPAHVLLDRRDVLGTFLARIGVIQSQVSPSAGFSRNAEIEADRHDVPNVQVAVRLRRKTRHDLGVLAGLEVVVNDLANKIARFCFAHGGKLYAN